MTHWMEDSPVYTKLSETKPVAAKDYTCYACSQIIRKGTKHLKFVHKSEEGKICTDRMHVYCIDMGEE